MIAVSPQSALLTGNSAKSRPIKTTMLNSRWCFVTSTRLTFYSIPNITVHPTVVQNQNSWNNCLPSASKINNLCSALVSVRQQKFSTCCIGVLDDQTLQHHIHSIKLPTPTTTSITLRNLLVNHTPNGFHVKEKCVPSFLILLFLHYYGETHS